MFAVPGWSVSANALKTQSTITLASNGGASSTEISGNSSARPTSRKRKRGPSAKAEASLVTADNFVDLWQKHIEGKVKPSEEGEKPKSRQRERRKWKREKGGQNIDGSENVSASQAEHGPPEKGQEEEKDLRINAMESKAAPEGQKAATELANPVPKPDQKMAQSQPEVDDKFLPATKLTQLQSSMRQKLISSRFRFLNQTLYTTPSKSSYDLFSQNPNFFSEYHEGFRRQVTSWPENPVDILVKSIQERGVAGSSRDLGSQKSQFRKQQGKKKKKGSVAHEEENPPDAIINRGLEPLPRNFRTGICTIADLGCGDGQLSKALSTAPPSPPYTKKLNLRIHSFDLVASSPFITVADISSLPLADGSTDIAIFCLALMGTNWIDFIEEAYRILRWKGECWIVEVGSRFAAAGRQQQQSSSAPKRVAHSVGNRSKTQDNKNKKKIEEDGEDEVGPEELGVAEEEEATGPKTPAATTDVSAFLALLRRRGFVLQGEPELGNKMFVRMRFLKAEAPTKGKGASGTAGKSAMARAPGQEKWPPQKKFIDRGDAGRGDAGDGIDVQLEAKVLKPCVYKTR